MLMEEMDYMDSALSRNLENKGNVSRRSSILEDMLSSSRRKLLYKMQKKDKPRERHQKK